MATPAAPTSEITIERSSTRLPVIRSAFWSAVTHGALAELLGVRRSSVQRVLKSLESAGLIELHYRRIDIVDPVGLGALLEKDAS